MPAATRAAAAVAVLLAVAAYLHGLGQPYIPSIGDEPLYLQIARVTAESGRLLPLVSETGITDTKPPLLFWQGIAAIRLTGGADLFWLRLPNVLLTFATAAAAGLLAARLSGRRHAGLVAALAFLVFRSTIQHGRPFLPHAGETLFLFLPVVLLAGRTRTGPWLAAACGASLGAAALYKSFAVVLPGAAGMAAVLLRRNDLDLGRFLRRHGLFVVAAAALGLLVFAGWILLDPRPDLVVARFVLHENAGKFRADRFLAGLVTGPYALWRLWLGPILNAGLLAPLVVGLLVDLWRRRRDLPAAEAELWLYVVAFLVAYSIPTQRQDNYLLPASAALAVLLALRWDHLGVGWFRLALVPIAVAAAVLSLLEVRVERAAGLDLWTPAAIAVPAVLAVLAGAGAIRIRIGRAILPALGLLALVAITAFTAPFSRRLPAAAVARLAGAPAWFPSRFDREHELFRHVAPGADVRGYDCPPGPVPCPAPATVEPGAHVAALVPLGATPPPGEVIADVVHLRTRHSAEEIRRLLAGELGLLVERLVVVAPDSRRP